MRINFRQGIITYPATGTVQSFLRTAGNYVSLQCGNGRTDVAFAHLTENYLLSETVDVPNAWGPLPAGTDCWLYWDIDLRTAVRTFGYTTTQPIYSPSKPTTAVDGQHWFNTSNTTMYVATTGTYRPVARVFAAKVNSGSFTPLGSGVVGKPYAGTQAGVTTQDSRVGRILVDDTGAPIRRTDGRLFTTEANIFVDGSPVNVVNLEGAVVPATAVGVLPKFHVVKFIDFGKIDLASYNDIFTSTIALLTEDLTTNQVGSVVLQGYASNPEWNWSSLSKLWIDDTGALIDQDPHVTNPQLYPEPKVPVARVVSRTSVVFDQGLGGTGERGPASNFATTDTVGDVRLSTDPVLSIDPVVVGDNDPRMTDARTPLTHTQAATTVLPTTYGLLTGPTLQDVLVQIEDNKLGTAGGQMTGALTLAADPTMLMHAATKQYVDANIGAVDLSSRVAKTGDTMTGALEILVAPTLASHATTKEYVDTTTVPLGGGQMTGALTLAADPTMLMHAATKQYVDSKSVPYDVTLACSDTTTTLEVKPVAAWAISARTFTTETVRADLLTASTSGSVDVGIVVDGVTIGTLSIPQLQLSASLSLTHVVSADSKIVIQIAAAGVAATGLILTIKGAA